MALLIIQYRSTNKNKHTPFEDEKKLYTIFFVIPRIALITGVRSFVRAMKIVIPV